MRKYDYIWQKNWSRDFKSYRDNPPVPMKSLLTNHNSQRSIGNANFNNYEYNDTMEVLQRRKITNF